MTGLVRTRQNARISAKVHAEQRRAAMSPERREQLERDWNDTTFDAAYDFTRRWKLGEMK